MGQFNVSANSEAAQRARFGDFIGEAVRASFDARVKTMGIKDPLERAEKTLQVLCDHLRVMRYRHSRFEIDEFLSQEDALRIYQRLASKMSWWERFKLGLRAEQSNPPGSIMGDYYAKKAAEGDAVAQKRLTEWQVLIYPRYFWF